MEYNEFKTLKELAQTGVNVANILQVDCPIVDLETLEYNYSDYSKNVELKSEWLNETLISKINTYPKKVLWFAGNFFDERDFKTYEFQENGAYGLIKVYFPPLLHSNLETFEDI